MTHAHQPAVQKTETKTPAAGAKSRVSTQPKTAPAWTNALGAQPALPLQPKLTVNQPGDEYEQEADRVAGQVMRMPTPTVQRCTCGGVAGPDGECAACKAKRLALQRKAIMQVQRCACGGVAGPDGECTACKAKRLGLQRKGSGIAHTEAPPSVHQTLHSSGQPLDASTRAFMEPRFGQDFSSVRVHTSSQAAQSAADVSARAYTVGNSVVFGAGEYSPSSSEGQELIAHELTHTMQQSGTSNDIKHQTEDINLIQRWANCNPARLALYDNDDNCPPRKKGEKENAQNNPMMVFDLNDELAGTQGALVINFDIGKSAIKPSLKKDYYWQEFLNSGSTNVSKWKILGFSDCQGDDNINKKIRQDRATAVYNILPKDLQPQIISYTDAPLGDCITENSNMSERMLNRSAAIILVTYASVEQHTDADFPAEKVKGKKRKKTPKTENCSEEQRNRIAGAFAAAEAMLQYAMSTIDTMERGTDQESLLKKYFGEDALSNRNRKKIWRGFRDTSREWKNIRIAYPVVCIKQGDGGCDPVIPGQPITTGYVEFNYINIPIGNIHICEQAFEFPDGVVAATLIHEASHRLDWTRDKQYCDDGCTLDTETAIDNADSYAQFAKELFERGY